MWLPIAALANARRVPGKWAAIVSHGPIGYAEAATIGQRSTSSR